MNNQAGVEANPTTKRCPSCHTGVSLELSKCPYCGSYLVGWFKRHQIISVLLGFLVFTYLLGFLVGLPSLLFPKDPIQRQETKATTRSSFTNKEESADKTSLEYKIRYKRASKEERFIVNGVEVRIGEAADSVFQKLPESLGTRKIGDKEYGMVVEHNYGKYSILFSRNRPEGNPDGSWFVVQDVFLSSDNTP